MSDKKETSTKIRPRVGRWEIDEQGEVTLLGTHCNDCGETAFPEHSICVKCGSESTELAHIGGPATLRNFTVVHQLPSGFKSPWAVGYGDFAGELVVLAPIVGAAPEDLHEGITLKLSVGVTSVDKDGEEFETYQFTPVEA